MASTPEECAMCYTFEGHEEFKLKQESSTQPTNKSLKATDDDDSAAKDALQLCCFYHKFLTYGFCSHVSSLLLDQHFQDERGNFCMAH